MNRAATAGLLVALTVGVRLHPFLEGNDDGDVGTYVLIARDWLHGTLPYTHLWEYKPPGLFAVYAAALAVFGDASRAAAALGALAASVTTLLVWRLGARMTGAGETGGVVAAVLWACASIENDGLLADAELLTVPFIAAALFVACPGGGRRTIALSGLLAGCAVQMKLTALLPAAVPLLAVCRVNGVRGFTPFAGGFAAPVVADAALYGGAGHFDALWDANVGATLRRLAIGYRVGIEGVHIERWLRATAPIAEAAPFAWLAQSPWTPLIVLWFAAQLSAVVLTGEYDARQLVPLAAPLTLLAAAGITALARRVRFGAALTATALAATFALHGYYEVASSARIVQERHADPTWRRSEDDRLVARLRGVPLAQGGSWFVEVSPILYDRLAVAPPTRYPLTSNLFNPRLWPMLGVDGSREIARIMNVERPAWVVAKRCGPWCDPTVRDRTMAMLAERYRVVAPLDARTVLLRRRDLAVR